MTTAKDALFRLQSPRVRRISATILAVLSLQNAARVFREARGASQHPSPPSPAAASAVRAGAAARPAHRAAPGLLRLAGEGGADGTALDPEARPGSVVGASAASSVLPPWINDYLAWHAERRRELTPDNWHTRSYLVLRCYAKDRECGGASDRLQSLPYLLYLAHASQRMLLVHWMRPAPLEEFLVPPPGGLNWTVPEWLAPHFPYPWRPYIFSRQATIEHLSVVLNASLPVVDVYDQSDDHGARLYNQLHWNEPSFDDVYGALWARVFKPAPAVADLIRRQRENLGMLPVPSGDEPTTESGADARVLPYVSLHIRARYWHDKSGESEALENAVHCALRLLLDSQDGGGDGGGGRLLYVTTDSINATQYTVQYGNRLLAELPWDSSTGASSSTPAWRVVARSLNDPHAASPLHLDRGSLYLKKRGDRLDWDQFPASAYFDTFVDLYLLAGGRCTAYGLGGYGKWANLLSPDPTCYVNYLSTLCPRPW